MNEVTTIEEQVYTDIVTRDRKRFAFVSDSFARAAEKDQGMHFFISLTNKLLSEDNMLSVAMQKEIEAQENKKPFKGKTVSEIKAKYMLISLDMIESQLSVMNNEAARSAMLKAKIVIREAVRPRTSSAMRDMVLNLSS